MFSAAKTVFIVVLRLYNETVYKFSQYIIYYSCACCYSYRLCHISPPSPFDPCISNATSKHVIASVAARKSHGATILCPPCTVRLAPDPSLSQDSMFGNSVLLRQRIIISHVIILAVVGTNV
jgi:hypothetical protein